MTEEQQRKVLWRAFNFGQSYFSQADSESYAANRRSDETLAAFNKFVDGTIADAALQTEKVEQLTKALQLYLCAGLGNSSDYAKQVVAFNAARAALNATKPGAGS